MKKEKTTKRGQAALEFLMTYGWAILAVMIAVGALVYFGILNPSKVLPEHCLFGSSFDCVDYQVIGGSGGSTNIMLKNGMGQTIYNPQVTLPAASGVGTIDCQNEINPWPVDSTMTLTCDTKLYPFVAKDKAKLQLTLTYKKTSTGYDHIQSGEIYATVQ